MTAVTWLGCDLATGEIIEDLPDLAPTGPVGRLLGTYTSATLRLPLTVPPRPGWEAATEPGRSMIVAVLGGQPVWAGIPLVREGGTAGTVSLGCVSIEGYLNRRYVADHTWNGQDESSVIAAGLAADAAVEGIGLAVDAPPTGTVRDRAYQATEDATVYSRLRELMGVEGGPEWTIVLGWTNSSQSAVSKTLRVRKRIGYVSDPSIPQRPTGSAVVLSSAGAAAATYTYREDYSAGAGANHVRASSTGDLSAPLLSAPARAEAYLAAGWPRYEARISPSNSITSMSTLAAHARAAVALTGGGAHALTITMRDDADPVLGTDWDAGDDIGYELTGHRHPGGLTGLARSIGWEWDPLAGTVSPILLAPGSEVV